MTAGPVFGPALTGAAANALPNGIGVAFNNSNTAGVAGGIAAAVTTGIELFIPLAAIGNPVGDLKISAMINASNHDDLSNQFLGGLAPGQGNLGGDGIGGFNGSVGQLNMNNFAGDQCFTVPIPAPSAISVIALAGIAHFRRRRA